MNTKISVIIPVYKVEPYIRQCLDSVVNQTYTNLEIIIIDDGSPDNCGDICDEYAENDARIKVIHKENGGLAAARNDGIKLATGNWISFVDSDDWLELNMYEKVVNKAKNSNADITLFSLYRETQKGAERVHAFSTDFVSSDKSFIYQLQLLIFDKQYNPICGVKEWRQAAPWDKFFKTSMIKKNNLTFPEHLKIKEDMIFNMNIFHYAKSVAFIDLPLYHFRANPMSITKRYTPNKVDLEKNVYDEFMLLGQKYNLSKEYYEALNVAMIYNVVELGKQCFFHDEQKKSLLQNLKYAKNTLNEEPFYSVFREVDRKKLGKIGKFITLTPKNNAILLYTLIKIMRITGRI